MANNAPEIFKKAILKRLKIMVPALRKRHRRIWLTLSVIMPVLFVLAVLVIPEPTYQEKLYQVDFANEVESKSDIELKKDNQ